MPKMSKKRERAEEIISALEKIYPNAKCSLEYSHDYELMIAGRLSAQCTDARVNIVTKELFRKYPTLQSFAEAEEGDIAEIIRPCGLYKTKAHSISLMTKALYYDLNGVIPDSIEELTKLAGIGRKTANLIMGDIHGKPAVVADTHCIRISGRLGLTSSKDPKKVEDDLRKLLPPDKSSDFCHRLVLFGRDTCTARKPDCEHCAVRVHMRERFTEFECRV
ncbi:MAG: endonuclease III [Ruminococcus sp.]|nr:endonuclease III [Ruminococcus sp.]